MINIYSAFLLLCCIATVHAEDIDFIKRRVDLRNKILKNYTKTDVKIRPSNETNIYVTLVLTSLRELDIESQTLSTTFYLHLSWFDVRLTWTPDAQHNEYFLFDIDEVWTPNFVIDNFVEDNGLIGIYNDGPIPLRVSHNGSVIWILRISTITICRADITFYPYDTQTCHINITEWAYTSSEVNLVPAATEYYPDEVYIGTFTKDGEWELMNTIVHEKDIVGGFGLISENLQYIFEFQRRPAWYIPILMIPLGLMSILMSGVFLVPVESGEKLTYSLTVMLSFTVTLSFISHTLPSVSSTRSVLGVYIAVVMVTSGLIIVLTAMVLYFHHKRREGQEENHPWRDVKKFDGCCFIFFSIFYTIMMFTFVGFFNRQALDGDGTFCVGTLLPFSCGLVGIVIYWCVLCCRKAQQPQTTDNTVKTTADPQSVTVNDDNEIALTN